MDYYSVSRLKTYTKCSMYYKHQYVDKNRIDSSSYSTSVGKIVHSCLEHYYLDTNRTMARDYFNHSSRLVLAELLNKEIDNKVFDLLLDYANSMSSLYLRSSEDYKGSDRIRTKAGLVPSNPSMTTDWKLSYSSMNLDTKARAIDSYFSLGYSISDAFSDAKNLIDRYSPHPYLEEVIAVELAISKNSPEGILNAVRIPSKYVGDKEIYLNGYVDLIAKMPDGVIIVDHKTNSSDFTESDVRYNVQLLTYVYAYYEITGIKAKYIGINNIRRNNLCYVQTPSDSEIEEILDSLFFNHTLIEKEIFTKHSPENYSPCLSMYGSPCPYLSTCWPQFN